MANFLLDKGYLAQGTTAYAVGEVAAMGTVAQSCKRSVSAADPLNFGIMVEACDAAKLVANPTKIYLNVRRAGIARAIAGGTISKGDRLTNDTSARVVKQVTAGGPFFAIAEEDATVDTFVDVYIVGAATI